MPTTPTPTGKIKGSFRDVTPKLRNFVGALKVTTPKGKGGILMEMGKPVAAYITRDGVLHKGRESLDLLDTEPLAEFEVIRYDDEQFREAMAICDNRGLLTIGEKEAAPPAASQARETKPREEKLGEEKPREEEKNLLSSMMKRFASPKPTEKKGAARETPKAEPVKAPLPVGSPSALPADLPAAGLPVPTPPSTVEKAVPAPGRKETPAGETDLSAIIKRLRESSKAEKAAAPTERKAEEAQPKPGSLVPEGKVTPAGAPATREERPAAVPPGGNMPVTPAGGEPEGRVKVDLGQMMKRIKRLDITSIRQELEEGAPGGEVAAGGAPQGGEMPVTSRGAAPAPSGSPAQAPESAGTSDIDELKAFIKKLEVLEEPKEEPPSEKGLLGRLGVKAPAGEPLPPAAKREVPAPIPRKARPLGEPVPEEMPSRDLEEPAERPPVEKPLPVKEKPKPAEPDRKAKIASLLRRSGLVKPAVEETPKEIIVPPKELKPPAVEEEIPAPAPAPVGEQEIRAPPLQRKKVEITRVPKKPERPLREPPLMDEKALQKVLKQPGVIAVSTFFEGFAVQSVGRADFEQVAANAEDLFRAGKKIAQEIDIGPLNQILLETGRGKLIIAPHGDLNVAIFTEPDANLGLIRMAIKGLQVEKD